MRYLTAIAGIFFVLVSSTTFGQEYKPFRVGIGFGFVPKAHDYAGFSLYVEPSYRIVPKISLGFRIESMSRIGSSKGGNNNGDIGALGSYTLNGQYYFSTTGEIHFFAGAGVGIYLPNNGPFVSCSCENQIVNEKLFGAYPRLGFDYRHLVVTVEVNLVKSAKQKTYYDLPPNPPFRYPAYYQASTDYVSLKLGVFIGEKR